MRRGDATGDATGEAVKGAGNGEEEGVHFREYSGTYESEGMCH